MNVLRSSGLINLAHSFSYTVATPFYLAAGQSTLLVHPKPLIPHGPVLQQISSFVRLFDPRNRFQDVWIYSLHSLSGQYLFQLLTKGRAPLSFLQRLLALTGALTLKTICIHPLWVAHLHYLHLHSGNVPIFKSTLHALKVIFHTSPLFLLSGIGETVVPSVLLGLLQFTTYEVFKMLPLTPRQRHLAEPLRAAVVELGLSPLRAIINAAICNTPFFSDPAYERYPSGTLPIVRHIYKKHGIHGFYRGYLPSLMHKGASWAISSLILALPIRHTVVENFVSLSILIASAVMDRNFAARHEVTGDLHGNSTAQLLAHLSAPSTTP